MANSRRPDARNGRIAWVRLFLKEFRGHTGVLTPAGVGAYMRLLIAYLEQQEPLEDDDRRLARIVGVSLTEWKKLRPEIEDVMDVRDGHFHDQLADERIRHFKDVSATNRANVASRHTDNPDLVVIDGGKRRTGGDYD